MKALSILTLALVVTAGSANATNPSKNTLVPCTPSLCGDFPQNDATLSLDNTSYVAVIPSGRVTVNIVNLRDKATGAVMAHKSLQVIFGTLLSGQVQAQYLGSFVTDGFGNYKGPAMTPDGLPYTFDSGTYVGNFLINDPAIPNTQFTTGFSVP
jgi:hypothetical protein